MIAGFETNGSAVTSAATRLIFVHMLQPLVYFAVLDLYWDQLTPQQEFFGVAVAVREVLYLGLSFACIHANPAYLLCDTLATWFHRDKRYVAVHFIALFVFSPEKYVFLALVSGAHTRMLALADGPC